MRYILWTWLLLGFSASGAVAEDGITLGWPYYFYPSTVEAKPAAEKPEDQSKKVSQPGGYCYAPPRVYRTPDGGRTLVEEIYRDGKLVETRVKKYPADWAGYK